MNKIEKLLIYDATNSRATAHVFIARPSPAEERILGKLGFLAEITSADRINQELLSRLQDFLKAAYYTSPEVNPEVAFEHTIQACNRYLGELISDFGSDWVDNFSMVIFTILEEKLHFADTGKILGLLMHEKKVIDLLGKQNRLQKVNPIKMFASIASGEIKNSDAIFFSTSNVLDYFSIEKLRRTIAETPLGGAAEFFEEILRQDPTRSAFASIILRGENVAISSPASQEQQLIQNIAGAPKKSIDNMLAQNAQTQELLTPSLWPTVKKSGKRFFREAKILFRAWVLRKPTRISSALENENTIFEKQNQVRKGQVLSPSHSRLVAKEIRRTILSKIPRFVWQRSRQAIQATPKLIHSIRSLGNNLRKTPQQIPVAIERQVNSVKGLPQKSRMLFLSTITIALILAIVLIVAGIQRQRSSSNQTTQNSISTIQSNIESARSALLYGDEDRAKTLLTEAKKLTNNLPNKSKSQKTQQTTLLADIEAVLVKTRHEIKPEIKTLATFKTGVNGNGLVILGKNLFTINANNNQLISISSATGEVKELATLPGNTDITELSTFGSGSLIALTSGFEIIEQKPSSTKGTRLSLVLPNANANLAGFATYNTALYSIDIANNLILKATRQGTGYKAVNWLKQSQTLNNATDLSVDGSLYVLTNQGEVMKFNQGQRVQLALSTVEPSLSSADKLAADTTLQNLYILDKGLKRIAVFSKAGKFINQYALDAIGTTSDFTVDESAQKIYLLNGNNLQVFGIQK
ncbi:MAG: hypothetical protein WCT08_00945 [Patescibacteria group bacterium]|jgi:type II secretory pathway pseudopilin PulG